MSRFCAREKKEKNKRSCRSFSQAVGFKKKKQPLRPANADYLCHSENFLTEAQLFGISGSRLRAPERRLCRGTTRAAVFPWRFPLSVFGSPVSN